ncbi:MAG: thioredoxin family protein [Bdellovibrionales bacterium]|nr:thioredoxin family protein [Bdellovibrionales bacterium]
MSFRNFALVATLLFSVSVRAAEPEIQWRTPDLKAAIEESSNTHKTILAFFYADWCGPSQRMLKEVFHDPSLVELINRDFIPLKFEQTVNAAEHAQYHINKFPVTILMRAGNGEEIERLLPNDPSAYSATLVDGRDHGETISELEAKLSQNPGSFALKSEILFKNANLVRPDAAVTMLERIKAEHPDMYPAWEEKFLLGVGNSFTDDRHFKEAIPYFEQLTRSPDVAFQKEGLLLLSRCQWNSYREMDAQATLKEGIRRFPDDLVFYMYYVANAYFGKLVDAETYTVGDAGLNVKTSTWDMAVYRYYYAHVLDEVAQNLKRALDLAEEAVSLAPDNQGLKTYRDDLKRRLGASRFKG